jgi:hypothetical protein
VDEDPHVKSWEDGQYNIMNMSIEETYGFGILNEGQAIAVAKNVKIRPNEFVMPARSVFNLSEQSSALDQQPYQEKTSFRPLCHPCNPLPQMATRSRSRSFRLGACRRYALWQKRPVPVGLGARLSWLAGTAESAAVMTG